MATPLQTGRPQLTDDQLQDARLLRAVVPQHVVYRTLAAETVVLNIETGMYYGLNETAGRMMQVLESSPTLHDALHRLIAEFGVPEEALAPDLLALCNDLGAKGLIEFQLATTGTDF